MPENKLIKSRLWMIGLIVIVAGISAGLLTAINLSTKERIALNKELKLKKSVLNVFEIPYEKKEIINTFNRLIDIQKIGPGEAYRYSYKGSLRGVAFKAKGAGFWGPISFLVALGPDLDTIQAIEIVHQEKTPY